MKSNTQRFVRGLVLTIAICALAVSVVWAAPSVNGPTSATPQTARGSDASGVVLRRDGSQAVPFVADVGPEATATSEGFDWGDAGTGATAMLALVAIAGGAGLVFGRRPSISHTVAQRDPDPGRT